MTWYSRKLPSYGYGGGFMKTDNLTFYIKPNQPLEPPQVQNSPKTAATKKNRKRKSPSIPKQSSKKAKTQSQKKPCKPKKIMKQSVSVSKNNFI